MEHWGHKLPVKGVIYARWSRKFINPAWKKHVADAFRYASVARHTADEMTAKTKRSLCQTGTITPDGWEKSECITRPNTRNTGMESVLSDAFKKPALISATTVRRKALKMMLMIMIMLMKMIHCLMSECSTNVTLNVEVERRRGMKAWDREEGDEEGRQRRTRGTKTLGPYLSTRRSLKTWSF